VALGHQQRLARALLKVKIVDEVDGAERAFAHVGTRIGASVGARIEACSATSRLGTIHDTFGSRHERAA